MSTPRTLGFLAALLALATLAWATPQGAEDAAAQDARAAQSRASREAGFWAPAGSAAVPPTLELEPRHWTPAAS